MKARSTEAVLRLPQVRQRSGCPAARSTRWRQWVGFLARSSSVAGPLAGWRVKLTHGSPPGSMPAADAEAEWRTISPNYRLVKIHFNYSVEDVSALFGVHKNTVREWLRRGLPTIDRKRPLLILGSDLASFLKRRRESAKRPCKPDQLYCVKCRRPRTPAGGLVEFRLLREPIGNLIAICPMCDSMMYRRANRQKMAAIFAGMEETLPVAELHISQRATPSLDCDFTRAASTHANSHSTE